MKLSVDVLTINSCKNCGHSWKPRTRMVSARCPNCRSTAVSNLAVDGSEVAVAGMIAAGKGAASASRATADYAGPKLAAGWNYGWSRFVAICRRSFAIALWPFVWLISIKDDFAEDNPSAIALMTKLLAWMLILAVASIFIIKSFVITSH